MMTLRVVTPPTVEPLTLTEAKLHLRETTTQQDDLITALIIAARRYAEAYTRRALVTQTLELTLPSFPIAASRGYTADIFLPNLPPDSLLLGTDEILLPRPPLQSVTYIKYVDFAGNLQTIDATLYQVDTYGEPGRVKPTYLNYWQPTRNDFNAVQIRYVAGYAPDQSSPTPANYLYANVPEEIRQWMRVRVAQLYEHREAIIDGHILQEIPRSFVDGLLDPYVVGLLG